MIRGGGRLPPGGDGEPVQNCPSQERAVHRSPCHSHSLGVRPWPDCTRLSLTTRPPGSLLEDP